MPPAARRPSFQPGQEERRALLCGHYLDFLDEELAGGGSFADLGIDRLLAGVQISRSTFYSYFSDKNALLQALVEIVTVELVDAARPWFQLGPGATQADLKNALRPLYERYQQHRHVLRSVVESAHDARIREQYETLMQTAVANLSPQIARITGRPIELDPLRTAQWLVAMHERGLYSLVSRANGEEFEDHLEAAATLTWRALYAHQA